MNEHKHLCTSNTCSKYYSVSVRTLPTLGTETETKRSNEWERGPRNVERQSQRWLIKSIVLSDESGEDAIKLGERSDVIVGVEKQRSVEAAEFLLKCRV
jgi:hypothetical protein